MRIGIDCQVLKQQHTGIPNYVRQLTEELKKLQTNHEFVFFDGPYGGIPLYSNHLGYAHFLQKQKLDILHGPANILPLFYNGPSVITVHDLAIYKHPEWFPRGQWFATRVVLPRSIKKARKIIVPSKATADDLKEIFHIADNKIAIIPHGVEERFFAKPGVVKKSYILFVGTLEPRKNLWRVIEAYQGLAEELKNKYELWIAGGKGWGRGLAKNETKGVKFLGFVSYGELPTLYQNASLFVYPSLYEGFGLPVLEAMAAGTPVVTSIQVAASFKHVAMVDPYSVKEISTAMSAILSDQAMAQRLGAEARETARDFTWEKTARETVAVYEGIK